MALTGDSFDFVQGGVVTSSAQLVDPAATVGDVLTVQSDKSIAAAPGGGSQPVKQETITGGASAASSEPLPFAHDAGDTLLDYTDPLLPTVIEAGTYAILFNVSLDPTDATIFTASVSAGNLTTVQTSIPVDVNVSAYQIAVSATVKLGAGDFLGITVYHNNTGSRLCSVTGCVVKLA